MGFDDAPFRADHRGSVLVVGPVYAGERLDGVLSCHVRRDGVNATVRLAARIRQPRFYPQLHAVLLQGMASYRRVTQRVQAQHCYPQTYPAEGDAERASP